MIIGCGASGGTAAQFARKTNRKAKITIFEKGMFPQYSKCGLPYTISGIIPRFSDLIEFDLDWFRKSNIELKLNTVIKKIDIEKKLIIANKGVETPYDSLIICTGANPIIPNINGVNFQGIFVLRTIKDIENIYKSIKEGGSATIIGAGLIGLEMADNLHKKDMKITIVEALPEILSNNLDKDMVNVIKKEIPEDIKILTNYSATKFESSDGKVSKVFVKNNENGQEKEIVSDLVIIATGTKPNIELARSIGCEIGATGGIVVNNKCETNLKNVYAAGDCTEYKNYITARPNLVGLGSIAVRQAIAAGTNSAGGEYILPKGVLNTSTSEFFGIEIATVGPTMNSIDGGFSIVAGKFTGSSLPDYFPGGKPVTIKVIVDEPTKMIMGAQCIGDKAASRINTFACAIIGELDIEAFRKLETAYAPSIAPTLDPITLVCDAITLKLNRKR